MATVARTQSQIDEQMGKAAAGWENGSQYPGMSYEEGVMEGIKWVLGETNDVPMPDE